MSQPDGGAGSGGLPLRPALKNDEDANKSSTASGSVKAVQIAEPLQEPGPDDESPTTRQFSAGRSRRLSGRPAPNSPFSASSSRSSTADLQSIARQAEEPTASSHGHQHRHHYSERVLHQIGEWLEQERGKASRRKNKYRRRTKSKSPDGQAADTAGSENASSSKNTARPRSDSTDSESYEVSLDKLQRILEDSMSSMGLKASSHFNPKHLRSKHRKKPSVSSLKRSMSSDTEFMDGDVIVPSCDACLDNSKTLGYPGDLAVAEDGGLTPGKYERERMAWLEFKNEIIRIAHTLKLRGWRRVPLEGGEEIHVQRLSGALTNAVYVVQPPDHLPDQEGKRQPPKLLLRIYGPQAENLIDRDTELKVLQRLARKKIGPRLLGTFQNGRFEQFFNATTLTPPDLRDPETSKQIAKRMRELHDGMELLYQEREDGPAVWRNWDTWLDNVEQRITHLDKQLENEAEGQRRGSVAHAWKANGYVCGVPWAQFKAMVDKHRDHLTTVYRGQKAINDRLTFAHNDTQYGNILRIRPDDEKSPLLQPANKHKQLIVIDFEYAAANTPGQEFANHFTEWTYNYHDATAPHACNVAGYPTLDEQRRFIKSYVDHQPKFPHGGSTPQLSPLDGSATPGTPQLNATTSTSSIVDFMLDARVPPQGWNAAEKAREEQSDARVKELMEEARLWRPINSAFWVAWGIVQANIPGLESESAPPGEDNEDVADEFDYLSYAQDRALFFWGDCVQMGLVKREELPERIASRLKIIDY